MVSFLVGTKTENMSVFIEGTEVVSRRIEDG